MLGTPEVAGKAKGIAMKHLLHDPAVPVYYDAHGNIVGILPKKARPPGLSKRDRALLAADIKQRSVDDMGTWSVARIADAFGASTRSVFEALNLSPAERDEVRAGRRPLFPRRSSSPPSPRITFVDDDDDLNELDELLVARALARALDISTEGWGDVDDGSDITDEAA
jgi:hypothetical protein